MSILVTIRHGESVFNREKRFTGTMDVALTSNGIEEAAAAGRKLKEIRFNYGVTSVLQRSGQTLDIILSGNGCHTIPVIRDKALNERNFGSLQGMLRSDAFLLYGQGKVAAWIENYTDRPPGGETIQEVFFRVSGFYTDRIKPLLREDNNILIVGHGVNLTLLRMRIEGKRPGRNSTFDMKNALPFAYVMNRQFDICDAFVL